MTQQNRLLSPEEERDLKRLMDEYNSSLRALPSHPFLIVIGAMGAGRMVGRKFYEIHPYLNLIVALLAIVFLIFYIPHAKQKRQENGNRLPIEIKREIKQKYNINLEQARAAFARTYGPTVLDSWAADNRQHSR